MNVLTVEKLTKAIGAEVTGLDLNDLSADDLSQIRALLLEHLVLFFPGQDITIDGHVALGRQFGDLEVNPNLPRPDGGLNRPGFVGGSRPWKRGWSHAYTGTFWEADDASVQR